MNLVAYTATALSRNDIADTPTNKNIVDGAIVELKDLDGNLVVIYDDEAGSNPETQKSCNTNGQLTFWAEVGDYILIINGEVNFITIGASVKFTKQSRQAIEAVYKAQGYNNVFFFEDGFTYAESNDVGIYEDGTAWTYADAGALPVDITAGTIPSEGVYKSVKVVLPPFETVAEMEAATYLSTLTEDTEVNWGGYFVNGDGGGNSGLLKFGAHTADGGSVFSIDANTYVEANLKGNRVSVRKFGARLDGETDDSSSLNNALSALDEVVIDGDLVYNNKMVLTKSIVGRRGGKIIRGVDTVRENLIEINGGSIKNIEIDGNKDNLNGVIDEQLGNDVMFVDNVGGGFANPSVIEGVTIYNSQSSCIAGVKSSNVRIRNVKLSNFNDHGIYFSTGSGDLDIEGVHFYGDCTGSGYAIQLRNGIKNVSLSFVTQQGNEISSGTQFANILAISNDDKGFDEFYNRCESLTFKDFYLTIDNSQLIAVVNRAPSGVIKDVNFKRFNIKGGGNSNTISMAQGNFEDYGIEDLNYEDCTFDGFNFLFNGADKRVKKLNYKNCKIKYSSFVCPIGGNIDEVLLDNLTAEPVSQDQSGSPFTVALSFVNFRLSGGTITSPDSGYIFSEPTGQKNSFLYFEQPNVLNVEGCTLKSVSGIVNLGSASASQANISGRFKINNTVEITGGADNVFSHFNNIIDFTNRSRFVEGSRLVTIDGVAT